MIAAQRARWAQDAVQRLFREAWPHAFLLVAVLIWVTPPLVALASRVWSTPQGNQGPIVLAAGIWAIVTQVRRERDDIRPGSLAIAVPLLLLAIMGAVLGRLMGMISLQALAALAGVAVLLYAYLGAALFARLWMPLVFLLALVPMPYSVEQALTSTLKLWVSDWSVDLLYAFGLDVANKGNALYVDQYQLYVDAACSGLNSIVSLFAIGIFYLFWQRRGGWIQAVVLALLLVPLAILANVIRVSAILILVHFVGDGVLATALHPGMGLVTFAMAIGAVVGLDLLLSPAGSRAGAEA